MLAIEYGIEREAARSRLGKNHVMAITPTIAYDPRTPSKSERSRDRVAPGTATQCQTDCVDVESYCDTATLSLHSARLTSDGSLSPLIAAPP